jgi:hypothetical protein
MEKRSHRGTIGRRFAVVVAVAAVSPVAGGIAAATKATAVPHVLVGSWTRTVTAADWKRAGSQNLVDGQQTMAVGASGTVNVVDFTPVFAPLPGGRLSISGVPFCYPKTGVYRWKIAGRTLTLTKLKDACPAEVGLFSGAWTRT